MSPQLAGSCHCGGIEVELATQTTEDEIVPRACGCDFCLKHRPNWFSDSNGAPTISHTIEPTRYRFGTETADFLFCPNCGVVIAAIGENAGRKIAVFNLNCLDAKQDWSLRAQGVDYDGEQTDDRSSRRAKNWMPVTLEQRN